VSARALAIAAQIRSGTHSATEVLAQARARIESADRQFNCFLAHTWERAQGEAAAIDALRAAGRPLPPLAGVPYAVKDLFDIAGRTTGAGGVVQAYRGPAVADAAAVACMRAAGAVLLGTLNMDEHAYGFTTENSRHGATRNPHDPGRIAGGSSGGSAAAVAAGLVPLTLGSDTNGSVRVPASLCGVFGLKPTYGRLSRRGVFPFAHSLDHVGAFAGNVADLAALYDVLQGPDAADPACAQRPAEPTAGALALPRRLRVGILGGWFTRWADGAARAAVQRAAAALGATRSVEWAGAEAARAAAFVVTAAEGGALHAAALRGQYALFEPLSRDRLVAGSLVPAAWVVQAQAQRRAAYEQVLTLFAQFDVLIAPATPAAAPAIGCEELDINGQRVPTRAGMGLLTQPISCVGLPVCTAPVWPADDRPAAPGAPLLPIGVQLIAAPWREDLCLAAAQELERSGVSALRVPQRPESRLQGRHP
jgi:aspartyl-tRNA(Asn)/glutamyl-tRNA(Gln) amidotransferase subunit A